MTEQTESTAWGMFREAATIIALVLGFLWLYFSSVLMIITVLRAIVR